MIGWNGVFLKNFPQTGFSRFLGGFNYGVHFQSVLFYSCEWGTKNLIRPSRGLRQGDPLSPYLFLFCVEGLNALFCNAASRGDIQGFFICRSGPKLTHLFFVQMIV